MRLTQTVFRLLGVLLMAPLSPAVAAELPSQPPEITLVPSCRECVSGEEVEPSAAINSADGAPFKVISSRLILMDENGEVLASIVNPYDFDGTATRGWSVSPKFNEVSSRFPAGSYSVVLKVNDLYSNIVKFRVGSDLQEFGDTDSGCQGSLEIEPLVELDGPLLSASSIAVAKDIPESGGVECSVSVEASSVGALEPVWLDLDCENRGTEPYTLLMGGGQVGLRVRPGPPGNDCLPAWSDKVMLDQEYSTSTIPPEAKVGVRVLLNQWFRPSRAGKYSVTLIDCRGYERLGGEALAPEVAFEVLPLDQERLAAVCDQLAQDALSGDDERAKEAARALSRIDSPVAIPYLEKVLEGNVFESFFVVTGLARINTPETARSLIEAFDNSGNVFTRLRIKDSLFQMKPQIDEPALRAKLDLVLAWQPEFVE